jgi:hypothetical protein
MRNNFRQKFCFEVLKFIECIMAPSKKQESTHPCQLRPLKCDMEPKGSPYMRETVENG